MVQFTDLLQQGKYKEALSFLKTLSEEEQVKQLAKVYAEKKAATSIVDMSKIKTISLLQRNLKPGHTYADFYRAWLPPTATGSHSDNILKDYFGMTEGGVIHATNVQDSTEITSIGLMPVDKMELAQVIQHFAGTEQQRHDNIDTVADKIGETKLLEIVDVILK